MSTAASLMTRRSVPPTPSCTNAVWYHVMASHEVCVLLKYTVLYVPRPTPVFRSGKLSQVLSSSVARARVIAPGVDAPGSPMAMYQYDS